MSPADFFAWDFAVSRDGLDAVANTGNGMFLLNLQSGEVSRISDRGSDLSWTPDGGAITFVRYDGVSRQYGIWRVGVDGGDAALLSLLGAARAVDGTFVASPDQVLFARGQRERELIFVDNFPGFLASRGLQ